MGFVARKPIFGVSDKVRLKPVSLATETSQEIEILLVASLDMILSNERTTKALIRLHGCTGWSAFLLFATPQSQGFSCRGPNKMLVIRAGIHKLQVRIANREDPDQTAS